MGVACAIGGVALALVDGVADGLGMVLAVGRAGGCAVAFAVGRDVGCAIRVPGVAKINGVVVTGLVGVVGSGHTLVGLKSGSMLQPAVQNSSRPSKQKKDGLWFIAFLHSEPEDNQKDGQHAKADLLDANDGCPHWPLWEIEVEGGARRQKCHCDNRRPW